MWAFNSNLNFISATSRLNTKVRQTAPRRKEAQVRTFVLLGVHHVEQIAGRLMLYSVPLLLMS